ncbi:MAG TPA: glycosyltransferase [Patescibacteria group bacterium]|nr:glycosyltransferase [Patescibacteria group bacterium]
MKIHPANSVPKTVLRTYFKLMREVHEKKQDLMLLYAEVLDIKKSSSFYVWQLYNTLMEYFGKERNQLPDLRRHDYVEFVTGDIYSEIERYKRLNLRMNKEITLLQAVKNGIEHSLYYKVLRKLLAITSRSKKTVTQFPITVIKALFPYHLRRGVRRSIEMLLPFLSDGIAVEILREWDDWSQTRSPKVCDVFIFGITAYGYRTQRPQHLALQLVKRGHRVFYIENEFISVPGSDWPFAPIQVKKQENNLYIVKLSCARNLFIYSDKPTEAEVEILFRSLRRLIHKANIVNPVAKIDHPFWGYLMEKMGMRVIYDCMDEHAGFQDNDVELFRIEEKIVCQSSAVLVSSDYLKRSVEKKKAHAIVMLPNAGEYEHFRKDRIESLTVPEDIAAITKPIIGYYGAIADWLDVELVEKASKTFPKYSFVFIGRVMNKELEELAKRSKNIYLLGEKPYEILPAYLKAFTVCTIPFLLSDLIKATHPVKFFEYAASGKPIVTTALPELVPYKTVCSLARSHKEYLFYLKKAAYEHNELAKNRMRVAEKNTWEMRGQVLEELIQKLMFPPVSIIVLSYNHADMTIRCLDSIRLRSFYPSKELIIVDNASEKNEREKIETYCKKYDLHFVPNKKNEGFAKGNNIGMKVARGTHFILLNNDTVVTPGWIERLVFHSQKDNAGLVGPVTNNTGNEMLIALPYNKNTLIGMEEAALWYTASHWGMENEWKVLAAFCWLLPKHVYKKVGGLDEQYGQALFEDDDYCVRVKRQGYRLIGAEDVFIHHEGSKSLDEIRKAEYTRLFERNKAYFEQKWNTIWIPHHLRNEKRVL